MPPTAWTNLIRSVSLTRTTRVMDPFNRSCGTVIEQKSDDDECIKDDTSPANDCSLIL
jgi:hypothetical protein